VSQGCRRDQEPSACQHTPRFDEAQRLEKTWLGNRFSRCQQLRPPNDLSDKLVDNRLVDHRTRPTTPRDEELALPTLKSYANWAVVLAIAAGWLASDASPGGIARPQGPGVVAGLDVAPDSSWAARAGAEALREIERNPPGRPWSEWTRKHLGASCVPFQGSSYEPDPGEYWVYRCRHRLGMGTLEGYACTTEDGKLLLERVSWSTGDSAVTSPATLRALSRDIVNACDNRYRLCAIRGDSSLFLTPVGGTILASFKTSQGLLCVVVFGVGPSLTRITIEHWSDTLAGVITSAKESDPRELWAESADSSSPRARESVARALKSKWPTLEMALTRSQPSDAGFFAAALDESRARALASDEADLLRYAVHLWLQDLGRVPGWCAGDSAIARPVLAAFDPRGIRVTRTHDGEWCVRDSLAFEVAAHAGQNPWADIAFLEVLDEGFEPPCELCGWDSTYGADRFKPVIEQGERFLRTHPSSPIAHVVLLRVAEAHETAWSLSKVLATNSEEYIDPRRYAPDAASHRSRAIASYERLIAEAPALANRNVRLRLARLRLDVDTDYHRYWCLWD